MKKEFLSKKLSPAGYMIFGFLGAIIVGSLLLVLPFATKSGGSVGYITALFTSTSAVCVTGLVVVDTASTWNIFGQTVIIILIQLGGLGIMSAAALFSLFLGKRIGLKERLNIQETLNEYNLKGIVKLFKTIMIVTFSIELLGAIVLGFKFIPQFGIANGIWKSVFHSISAFCNAGFDILGTAENPFTSLTQYQSSPLILLTISILFIIGGLGYVVWRDVWSFKKPKEFQMHTKVVLSTTLFLIVLGTITILLFENNNTLEGMTFTNKLLNSFFQAVTPRTAGFNSISYADMSAPAQFFSMVLMFIGAAPGSTGGGIKVTTIAIIFFTVVSYLSSNPDVTLFRRKVNENTVKKAISIIFFGLAIVFSTSIILMANGAGSFQECIFEAVSAFGTVGLSAGITPVLPTISRIAIVVTMFFGRVGPLAIALSISSIRGSKKLYTYPEGKISVG